MLKTFLQNVIVILNLVPVPGDYCGILGERVSVAGYVSE